MRKWTNHPFLAMTEDPKTDERRVHVTFSSTPRNRWLSMPKL
jgi:hypothetical protein